VEEFTWKVTLTFWAYIIPALKIIKKINVHNFCIILPPLMVYYIRI